MHFKIPSKKELMTIPNIMGYFRILLLPFIAYGILNNLYWVNIILLTVSALTDFLDGKIARKFNMVTEFGKALDPVADKLTLCILFICLMFKNNYARTIAIVMLIKEIYMLIIQFILKTKTGKTSGGAKWYGKFCTASLFLSLGLFLIMPYMTAMLSNIIMLITVYIMIFTILMYAYLFRSLLNGTEINMIKRKKKPDKHIHPTVRSFFFTLLLIILYLAAGATLPFIKHPVVNNSYEASFNISDYVSSDSDNENSDRVRLISTNEAALDERIRLIDMAKDSIILSSFDFRADESGSDVIAALCNAADRNVSIKIVVDGFSGILKMDGKSEFFELASKPTVEIKIYNPVNILEPWNLMGRMHDKYLIIDNYGYMLGGRNTYDLFLGSYNSSYKNLDLEVFVWNKNGSDSSSLYQVKEYFNSVWNLSYCEPFKYPDSFRNSKKSQIISSALNKRLNDFKAAKSDYLLTSDSDENTLPTKKIQLISNPTHRAIKEPYVWNTLYKLMCSANERVYLHTPYIICDKNMYNGLNEIGHKNIETKLLLNAPEIGANPFGCTDYISQKDKVLETNFSIYEYMGSYSYHAKAILIDHNLSIIGSYNTDMRSTYLDTELMLSIDSNELNAALNQVMTDAENQSKHTISKDEYTVPPSIKEAVFSKKDKIKNAIIIFITRPIRFLL